MSTDRHGSSEEDSEPILLVSQNIDDLFRAIDQSDGNMVIDLSLERDDSNPYVSVYNETPQLVIAHPLPPEDDNEYEIESEEIDREQFESLILNSEAILLKPRSDTPFSKETQQQLWDQNFKE